MAEATKDEPVSAGLPRPFPVVRPAKPDTARLRRTFMAARPKNIVIDLGAGGATMVLEPFNGRSGCGWKGTVHAGATGPAGLYGVTLTVRATVRRSNRWADDRAGKGGPPPPEQPRERKDGAT